MTDPKLSAAAQTVRRNTAQIMYELHQCCRISVSATDTLPITLETTEASLKAGINSLCAAAIRELADQVMPKPIRLPRNSYAEGAYDQRINDHQRLLTVATELENWRMSP